MKIDSLLVQYEKLVETAYTETDVDVLAKLAEKADRLEAKINTELLRVESGFGEDFAREYNTRFDKACDVLNKAT